MSTERDPAVLVDIANACQLVLNFIENRTKHDLHSDMLLQSAVLHQLLILGEAVRRLSDEYRAAHAEIEWSGYVGLRNVLIHQYDNVDVEEVWNIAVKEVSELHRRLAQLLPFQDESVEE
jgi:uncharacterized protein with HEPN domain